MWLAGPAALTPFSTASLPGETSWQPSWGGPQRLATQREEMCTWVRCTKDELGEGKGGELAVRRVLDSAWLPQREGLAHRGPNWLLGLCSSGLCV